MRELKKLSLIAICLLIGFVANGQIQWMSSYAEAKKIAKEQNKLIVVDCWANWCGPCKKMDEDVWEKDNMGIYAAKYVFVKLDLSSGFSNPDFLVKAIPKIFITDAWNNQFESITGYQSLRRMENLLTAYSFSLEDIYKSTVELEKDDENVDKALQLAMCYQEQSTVVEREAVKSLSYKSRMCFKQAEKLLKKSKNKDLSQKVQILSCLNKSGKKALKVLASCKPSNEENANLKAALLARIYLSLEQVENAKEQYAKIKDLQLPYYDFIASERKQLQ